MASIATYSTDNLPPRKRVKYWNEWSSATITRSNIEPANKDDFYGKVTILETGRYRFANFISDAANLYHTRSHIATENDHALILHFQLGGYSLNEQDGRRTVIHTGDYTLCDSSRPYNLAFDTRNDMLSIRIPHESFKQRISSPESLTCVHMSAGSGICQLVSNFIRSAWIHYVDGMDPALEAKLSENLLDLLATSYAVIYKNRVEQSSVVTSRKLLVKHFIEKHLSDPELSPGYIAAAFGYTPAYLHKLFYTESESLCRYIMRRRLEEAARLIGDVLHKGHTFSEIAYKTGFKSATHFGRVFKEYYDLTPTQYRQKTLEVYDTVSEHGNKTPENHQFTKLHCHR